jgi:hypothetical protein
MKKKITVPKVFASEAVLREKREEIKEMETMLSGGRADRDVAYRNDKIQEPDLIRHEIRKRQKFISDNTPKKLTGVDANKAYKRVKELEGQLKEAMPSQKQFGMRYPSSSDRASKATDFEKAVQQQMAFQSPQMQQMAAEYRHLMIKIDPQNPMVRNLERLRRAR